MFEHGYNPRTEIGMSWAVFYNFIGAGLLCLLVPQGLIYWGDTQLLGLFAGLSGFALILVWLFVLSTN